MRQQFGRGGEDALPAVVAPGGLIVLHVGDDNKPLFPRVLVSIRQ
jgi:hypothetical protein